MADIVTGGAAVVDSLVANGVKDVFGIPGTHNLELYRYLPDSGMRHIVTRHEQGAGYAADAYARVSRRPGVLLTTSGPGITNAITALGTSYADSVATLAISPGAPRGQVGADVGWLHELKNQQAALAAVCDRSIRVESADEIPEVVADVFSGFMARRPRPVHLEIPVDVLEGSWTRRRAPVCARPALLMPPHTQVVEAARMLATAATPVLIVGGGARGAGAEVLALAERGIAVLTTVNGKGILDERHPGSLGASLRFKAAHDFANSADLLVVAGSELGDSDLWGGVISPGDGNRRKVIRIDIDAHQINKNVPADVGIVGDSRKVLGEILVALGTSMAAPADLAAARVGIFAEAGRDAGPWAEIQHSLAGALPPGVIVAGDSSQVTYYGTVHYWPFTPTDRLVYPTGYATLGYGLPAAIGAKIASPQSPVVALFGDGAAMFSIQELITAVEMELPIPIVIIDNGGYAEIREQMVDRNMKPLGVDLRRPDFAGLARAMGAKGVNASIVTEIGPMAAEALAADGPTVIYHRVA
ncbi:MAG: thiamine pyrophosphate-dependent enzyme possible carboligase or decarboxylase [Aeromicrobium sp.]|nr:thiamine pyrophosphate-dependent enzyme possible carboligase or decarboxylase [Aeromicrobium sp.]